MFVYRYVRLYKYGRRGIIQEQAGMHPSIYNIYILYVYIASIIVSIITINVPPTRKEYLSVVNGEKPRMDGPLSLAWSCFIGNGGSSLWNEWAPCDSVPPRIFQGGTCERPRAVCQLPLLERSRRLEPRAERDHPCCWFKIWLILLDRHRTHEKSVF